ncbi:hypothetical protein [Kitasatospora sp. HPMI-4]|uniref:hypothetical protein n=1 Tax=Kitasatospora sp. HPMI-4 TaxID=3448443 RepID=UPI003F1CADFE
MLTSTLDKLGGHLGRRFLLAVWLPIVALASSLGCLAVTWWGWAHAVAWWSRREADARAGLVLAALALSVLAGFIWSARLPGAVRLLSGYWPRYPPLRWILTRRLDHYQRLHAEMSRDPRRLAELARLLPMHEDDVMPTRFGNIQRAAETYSVHRYGIDGVLALPRLYTVLPSPFAAQLALTAGDVEFMVTLCVLGPVAAVIGVVFSAVLLPWYAWLGCLLSALLLARVGYRGAVRTALVHAELVRTAFDVHRRKLIEAIGLQQPTSWAEELLQWEALGGLWLQGAPQGPAGARALRYPQQSSGPCPLCHPPSPGTPGPTGPTP